MKENGTFQSQHVMAFDSDSVKEIFGLPFEKGRLGLKLMRVCYTLFEQ